MIHVVGRREDRDEPIVAVKLVAVVLDFVRAHQHAQAVGVEKAVRDVGAEADAVAALRRVPAHDAGRRRVGPQQIGHRARVGRLAAPIDGLDVGQRHAVLGEQAGGASERRETRGAARAPWRRSSPAVHDEHLLLHDVRQRQQIEQFAARVDGALVESDSMRESVKRVVEEKKKNSSDQKQQKRENDRAYFSRISSSKPYMRFMAAVS